MTTPFTSILRDAVDETPGAIGSVFAARDGETVDFFSHWEAEEWAILSAHYGIVLAMVQNALHTFHFGEAEQILITHRDIDLIMQAVLDGYYALIALNHPASLAHGMQSIAKAARRLREEM